MKRRNFIKLSGLSTAGLFVSSSIPFLSSCSNNDMNMGNNMNMGGNMNMGQPVPVTEGNFSALFAIPPIVGGTTTLTAQNVTANNTGFGNISGLGYHSNGLLGPTIKVNSGQPMNVNFVNQLNEKTNIHWHGLKIPANMDGHPENFINAGGSFNYNFTVNQRAGLYWYHPHADGTTGKQVFQGLAGLVIVNDSEETALNLPSGNRELPLVIQDKRISAGSILYAPTMMDQMAGLMGQYILVNGVYAPSHNVETAKYRVRILNGSNARIYNLALSNGASFTVIGNDGGLLATPQTVNSLTVAPGERADLIIDFSSMGLNSELFLISKTFIGGNAQGTQEFKIMKFKVTTQVVDNFSIPTTLSSIAPLTESMATKTRNFEISNVDSGSMSGMMMHTINNKSYDANRIDEFVTNGAVEIWTFNNTNGQEPHPMHLHGVQFQILNRTGGRGTLTALEKGWKDMALCMPGEKVKVIVPFNGYTGKFVFHCHNLEHEETGMMGQFQVS
jgi:FtsP/CotA-like multicopper oxidase with cupredoxin domain